MANQSRDWHRSEGFRHQGRGQSYRDFDDDNRQRRGAGRWEEESNGPRSAEGIGDYGGYSEEGGSYESPRRGGQFGNDWRDQEDRAGGGYFGTAGGPDYGRAYDSAGAGPFGRGDMGRGDYGQGSYEQRRYGQGGRGGYGPERGYGQGSNYGQQRYGSEYGSGRRDYVGSSGGSSRGYGSQQWGSGDFGSQGGSSSFGSGRGENWGGGYGGPDYGAQSGSGYGGYSGSQQWERQASHRGKGPKGYERSDDRLKEVICERLSDDPGIDASEITVSVSGGVVKLTGTIDSRAEKYQVEELIERCGGVKEIDNQLRTQSRQSQGQGRQSSAVGGSSGLSGSSGSSANELGAGSGRNEGTLSSGTGSTTSSTRKQ